MQAAFAGPRTAVPVDKERFDVRMHAGPIIKLLRCHDAFCEPQMSIVKLTYHMRTGSGNHDSTALQNHKVDAVDLTNRELVHDGVEQPRDVWFASLVVSLMTFHESNEICVFGIDRGGDVAERQELVHLEACSDVVNG